MLRFPRRVALASIAGVVTATLAGVVACYAPTEVTLALTTNADCRPPTAPKTGVFLGPAIDTADPVAETSRCNQPGPPDENIGALVLVPRDARDARVSVHIVMTLDGSPLDKCREKATTTTTAPRSDDDPKKQCVVARRIFDFVAHRSRRLPIQLDRSCAGILCDDGTTCVKGQCLSALVPENASSCVGCEVPLADGGADGGATDGDAPADATGDASTSVCPGVLAGGTVLTTSLPIDAIAVGAKTLAYAAMTEGDPKYHIHTFALDRTLAQDHGTVDGDIRALAFDGNDLLVGTTVGLYRLGLAVPDPLVRFPSVEGVVSLAPRPDAIYFTGSVANTDGLHSVTRTSSIYATPLAVSPPGRIVFGRDSDAFLLGDSSVTSSSVVTDSSTPKITVALAAPKGIGAFVFTSGSFAYISTLGATGASPGIERVAWSGEKTTHCTTANTSAVAVDATGVYAVRTAPDDAVVVRCPPPTLAGPTSVQPAKPVETNRYGSIRAMALSPSPTGCIYFATTPASTVSGGENTLRAVPKSP